MKKDKEYKIAGVIFWLAILLLPIILYTSQFGYHLSENHQKWAEFGSAISGIYSPIIAFIALLILTGQFKSQVSLNKHQYDQTYIQTTREEINFFIDKMEKALKTDHKSGASIRHFLETNFAYLDKSQLDNEHTKVLASEFRTEHKIILDMWLAIYPLLLGLGSQKEFPYEHNFSGAILRIACSLSIETCIAIDNYYYYYCVTNDLQKGNYYFTKKI